MSIVFGTRKKSVKKEQQEEIGGTMNVKRVYIWTKIEGWNVISAVGENGSCQKKSMERFNPQKIVSFATKKWDPFLGSWHPSL